MSGNIPIYNFNEAEYESGRVAVFFHLTETKHSGVGINDLVIRLGVGRDTDLRTLESTTKRVVRRSNLYLGGRRLISRHDRLHYKSLRDRFYSHTNYVRPQFQSLHRDYVQFFSTKYHSIWAKPMDSDTRDNVGNALLSFTQQVGVSGKLVIKQSPTCFRIRHQMGSNLT